MKYVLGILICTRAYEYASGAHHPSVMHVTSSWLEADSVYRAFLSEPQVFPSFALSPAAAPFYLRLGASIPLSSFLPISGTYVADGLNDAISLFVSRLTMIFLLILTLLLSSSVTAFPSAIPLAVRSPYFNCWLPVSNNISTLGQTWPTTFNLTQVCHLHIFSWL